MKTIYFMRHTQSEANLQDIVASRLNVSLTKKGKSDAKIIADRIHKLITIDRVISSPLMRAKQTAIPIAKNFGLLLEIDDRLIEQDLGVFSGMSYNELNSRNDYMHDRTKRWKWIPENGESYEMIAMRLKPFFKSIDSIKEKNIMFVTHAVTMRLIRACLEKTLPQYPHQIADNGEIWEVNWIGCDNLHVINTMFGLNAEKRISSA